MIGSSLRGGPVSGQDWVMGLSVAFASRVPREKRHALEQLLFFNGCQERFARDIEDVIDRFGSPEIYDDGEGLRVRVAALPDVQSLFAIDPVTGRPLGLAVYMRADLEHVTVLHLGLVEDYCSGGPQEGLKLLLQLMREVRRTSRRIKGVRRLEVLYRTQRVRASAC
jgi:hypothetical protein